jgi:hypothetical protein
MPPFKQTPILWVTNCTTVIYIDNSVKIALPFLKKFEITFPAQLPKVEKHFSIPSKQTTDTDLFFA